MQYTNYAMKNNVFGTLSAPISSLATSIQLATGQGQRFTADMLATLESMEDNKVTKREIVKITNVTGDTLTVIRKFAPCPSNDDANTQGQVSYSFSADDTISVYITKEHFDKIDGSINDLYDNGTNKLRCEVVSGLQVKVNPGAVLVGSAYYEFAGDTITLTNNATNYVEIDEDGDLVANTTAWGDKNTKIAKVTTSGGAVTSIEDRRLGTVGGEIGGVNIHEMAEKIIPSPTDELILSDSENIWNNKKFKLAAITQTLTNNDSVVLAGENLAVGDVIVKQNNTWVKATITNQGILPQQAFIVKKAANTGDPVFYDFIGVSTHITGLTVGAKYYISNTAGVLTTSQLGGFLVGTAIATNKLLLHNSYKALIAGDNYQLYYLENSGYGRETTYTQVGSYTAQENMGVRFKASLARGSGSASGSAHASLYLNGNLLQTRDNNNKTTPLAISYDFNCSAGDIISFGRRCDGQAILVYFNNIYITADITDKYL